MVHQAVSIGEQIYTVKHDISIYIYILYVHQERSLAILALLGQVKVFATLVSLMFQVPGLDWTQPLEHFECFSGDMEVTKAVLLDFNPKGLNGLNSPQI